MTSATAPGIEDRKSVLRRRMLGVRDALEVACRGDWSRRVAETAVALVEDCAGPAAAFWPIRSEIDTMPLIERLTARGIAVALPAVAGRGLVFRAWRPGAPLRTVRFGLREPAEDAAVVTPATLFVPLAAFDETCRRLGYGGGFYDRAIAALSAARPPLTIGLAFAAQQVASVPTEAHDRTLDMIVTEDKVFVSRKGF